MKSIRYSASAAALLIGFGTSYALADMAAAERWVDSEFQPSTLTREQQLAEMQWFIDAAGPFQGMEINVLSETIPTHTYESQVLTKAFEEITGIKVNHQLLGEGEVVQAVQTQMQTNRNLYDAYINDSDLIGTHSRLQSATNLTDWMGGEGKDVTNPGLDIEDFIGLSFTTGPDGKVWQLPDQQFANLYWFRKDWFDRPDLQERFKAKYGYDLGVPVDWSAYEDIADFFTNEVKEIDGVRVYGHMDYGKRAADLGWRMTDAWLSMAGATSPGLPNGRPIDEWGIRMEDGSCNPQGASVSRGGGTNAPAAVYAIRKWDEWLRQYAPPGAAGRERIVVYATTEPTEALLFGGNTATLFEGRVTQFGPTSATYRTPRDLVTAQVFSDPPINTAPVTKIGGEVLIGGKIKLPAGRAGSATGDGDYTIGIRPHHITPQAEGNGATVEGRVLVAELSGNESVVHFDLNGHTWVSQAPGIHPFEVGSLARLHIDVDRFLYFNGDGRLVAGGM